ncbi:MAG TPA: fructose-specific PTS transporter subunit EIIC [Geothrix sp.]|nr:fructose-specific PTS transporter subunit EIIC [Geothrix sp.]
MRAFLHRLKQYLLSGVSHVIPFVACGGILIAVAIGFAPMRPGIGPDFSQAPTLKILFSIGEAAFALVVPVLAGYIAFGMADRPALVPGFVGGAIAQSVGAGFLGGIAAGLLAGWMVQAFKRLPLPRNLRPIMPILILPVLTSALVGALLLLVLGPPIKGLMLWLSATLHHLGGAHRIWLGLLLGSMIAFDMGGPVNKAAFFFGVAMIKEGDVSMMGACAAAICIPPLGLGLATLLRPASWTGQERESGLAALAMGAIGITEGAIPFAAADPIRVIPTIMAGSSVGAVLALLEGVGDHAPHGGLIVLPVVDHRLAYLLAILAGSLVVALTMNLLKGRKRPASPECP